MARSWWVVNLVYSAARPEFSTGGPFYSNPAPPVKQTAKFFAHLKLFVRSQCFNKNMNIHKTLPEAQRTQGIDSLTWVISPAK